MLFATQVCNGHKHVVAFFQGSTMSFFPDEMPAAEPKKVADRGAHFTALKRARQFSSEFTVRDEGKDMWCIACGVVVKHNEKSYAEQHLKSKGHKKMKLLHDKAVPWNSLVPFFPYIS